MRFCRGTALTTVLTTVAAAGALAFAGFTTFGGKSLCSLMACDGKAGQSATIAANAESQDCPFSAQIAANAKKPACASTCSTPCGSDAEKAAFVTLNAAFPVAVPAAFNDDAHACPSTLVKASQTSCSKSASTCGSKAQTIAASNESKSCAKSCAEKASQTIAASNESKSSCSTPCTEKASQTVAASNEGKSSCAKSCAEKASQTVAASNEAKSTCSKPCDTNQEAAALIAAAHNGCESSKAKITEIKAAAAKGCATAKAQLVAIEAACAKSCDKAAAQTIAASNEAKSCNKPCDKAGATVAAAGMDCAKACDPAACAAKGCDPSQCASRCDKASFVTMQAAFPVAIPAAFNDQNHACPSTLVKASQTCTKVSAASECCSKSKAQAQTVAASNETKACCGQCAKTAEADTDTTEKSAG